MTHMPDWERHRNLLNHHWLKNQLQVHLDSLLNAVGGPVQDDDFIREFCSSILPRWKTQFKRIHDLIESFEKEMSPRTQFNSGLLSKCKVQSKEWLADLVHVLWLARNSVPICVSGALECARDANNAYLSICDALESTAGEDQLRQLSMHRKLLIDFRNRCERLSQAISRFPHRVLVT